MSSYPLLNNSLNIPKDLFLFCVDLMERVWQQFYDALHTHDTICFVPLCLPLCLPLSLSLSLLSFFFFPSPFSPLPSRPGGDPMGCDGRVVLPLWWTVADSRHLTNSVFPLSHEDPKSLPTLAFCHLLFHFDSPLFSFLFFILEMNRLVSLSFPLFRSPQFWDEGESVPLCLICQSPAESVCLHSCHHLHMPSRHSAS